MVAAAAIAVTVLPATAQVEGPTGDQYGEPCPPRGNNGKGPGPGPGRRVGPQGCRPVGPPPGPGRRVGPSGDSGGSGGASGEAVGPSACPVSETNFVGPGLCGGAGDDRIRGGPGPDSMDGGPDFDRCDGGTGGPNTAANCERTKRVPF